MLQVCLIIFVAQLITGQAAALMAKHDGLLPHPRQGIRLAGSDVNAGKSIRWMPNAMSLSLLAPTLWQRKNATASPSIVSPLTSEVLPAIRKYSYYEDSPNKMGQTIGTDGFHILGALVAGKARAIAVKFQRSAKMKIWSQLHAAYGVHSAEDIPTDQMDGARQCIAAYAI